MSYLDATAPQLAAAWGEGVRQDEALRAFLALFDAASVAFWLGNRHGPLAEENEPRFFRYLVLTCVIAVNDISGVDTGTNNFRTRLGQTLGMPQLQSVGGVNSLWKQLARWSEKRRARGLPVREIVLPDPGTMTLIGYAVRMAFPSWRDRRIFSAILERIPEKIRRSPSRLVHELARIHRTLDIPVAILDALEDFARRLRVGDTMLATHRFWSLVQSINAAFENEAGLTRHIPLTVELRFGGYDQDEPEFLLLEDGKSLGSRDWKQIVQRLTTDARSEIAKSLRRGHAIFNRSAGCWACDESGLDPAAMCVVIAKRGAEAKRWKANLRWRELDSEWDISGAVGGDILNPIVKMTGTAIRELVQPRFTGGIRLKKSVYLGQPGFLPNIEKPGNGRFGLSRLVGADEGVTIDGNGVLDIRRPTEGIWRISVGENGERADLTLSLEAHSPEPADYPAHPKPESWRPDKELRDDTAVRPLARRFAARSQSGEPWVSGEAICEAVFSRAGTSWREGELVELIKGALPSPMMVWDVIRSLQEAGWLDSFSSRVWRARRWHCRRPTFVMLSPEHAIVDGAVGGAVFNRIRDAARPRRINVEKVAGVSEYSPHTILVSGSGIEALALAMEWPCSPLNGLPSANTATQWLEDGRSPDGRRLASTWSHSVGLFLERATESTSVTVERWVRERSDESDLYVVRDRSGNVVKKTDVRVLAVLEGHRLNRIPLFEKHADSLVRIRKSGHLPLPVSRTLRFVSSVSAGPVPCENGSWSYRYGTNDEVDPWLRGFLGPGLRQDVQHEHETGAKAVEWRHRGGRRPAWNSFFIG